MGLRDFDSYSRPVMFTYKGKGEFDTSVGGVFSIITSLMLMIYGLQQLAYLFIKPDFSMSITTSYADFSINTETLKFSTKDSTIAVKMNNLSAEGDIFDVESIARI
jgi:hypothetical protein